MSDLTKLILHVIAAFFIAGIGACISVLTDLDPDQHIGDIRTVTWIVIALTAVAAGFKDLLTFVGGKKAGTKNSPQVGGNRVTTSA